MTELKVAILIPALNEAETIESVVISMLPYGKVIVIDDGSTDGTGRLAHRAGALVENHAVNCGYDRALVSGIMKALKDDFDVAITVDADGQHDQSIIANMLQEIKDGADIVVGARDKLQRVSEVLFSFVSDFLWGLSDPLCGMKAYRLSKLKHINSLYTYQSIGTELIITASLSSWDIRQIPIVTRERDGKSRFGSGIRPNFLITRAMILGILLGYSRKRIFKKEN